MFLPDDAIAYVTGRTGAAQPGFEDKLEKKTRPEEDVSVYGTAFTVDGKGAARLQGGETVLEDFTRQVGWIGSVEFDGGGLG